MYYIGICDDEISTCSQIEVHLEKYFKQHYIKYDILVFYNGRSLCDYLIQHDKLDLIFLDIELPKKNGIGVAKYLREILKNEQTDLIFISSKTQYALELFKYRPLDFLIKPVLEETIGNILDIVIKRNGILERNFEYQVERERKKVLLKEIVFFMSDNKKIHMKLRSGEVRIFNGKLSEIKKQIQGSLFLQIHKSYLVNRNYIIRFACNYVEVITGESLNISKSNRKLVQNILLDAE